MESWAQLVHTSRWNEEDGESCVSGPVYFPSNHGEPQPGSGIHLPHEPELARRRCRVRKGNLLEQGSRWSVPGGVAVPVPGDRAWRTSRLHNTCCKTQLLCLVVVSLQPWAPHGRVTLRGCPKWLSGCQSVTPSIRAQEQPGNAFPVQGSYRPGEQSTSRLELPL